MYKEHLTKVLLPYWKNLKDPNGGFYGEANKNGEIIKTAPKGGIYHSRILWFFANSYLLTKDESLLEYVEHCYKFIAEMLYDSQNKGMFWSVDSLHKPLDNSKHSYNNAFAIYGLCQYYKIKKDPKALQIIYELYQKIEQFKLPNGFYIEQFDSEYNPIENRKLCEVEEYAPYTMNTILHILEAYTDLYQITKDENVKNSVISILNLVDSKIYNHSLKRLNVFFNENGQSVGDIYSYGHDIEASWLIDRAVIICNLDMSNINKITNEIAVQIYEKAYINNSLVNECTNGIVDTNRIWWVQAESMVGFKNAYNKTNNQKYFHCVNDIWQYIKTNLVKYGEWVWSVDNNKNESGEDYLAGMWKAPYHNGRAMIILASEGVQIDI